jgi:DNA-binding response OmpR family regulator
MVPATLAIWERAARLRALGLKTHDAVHIRQLRQKWDDGHAVCLIESVYRQGCVLRAPESEEDRPAG